MEYELVLLLGPLRRRGVCFGHFKPAPDTCWQALLFASLSFGALTMLCEYQIVNGWVQKGDISALLDVVPSMAQILGAALAVGIFLNFFVLFLNLVKKD